MGKTISISLNEILYAIILILIVSVFAISQSVVNIDYAGANTPIKDLPLIDAHTLLQDRTAGTEAEYIWDVTPQTTIPSLGGEGKIETLGLTFSTTNTDSVRGELKFEINGSALVASMFDPDHSGAYVSGDFANLDAGASSGGTDETATITYPFTVVASTTYRVTIDLSTSGFYEVRFQDGINPEVTVGQFVEPSTFVAVEQSSLLTRIVGHTESSTECSDIVNDFEVDIAITIDSVQQDLGTDPLSRSVCGVALDKGSYDSPSKTATLHQIDSTGQSLPGTVRVPASSEIFVTTSLDEFSEGNFSDDFSSSLSSSQQIYIHNKSDGLNGFESGDSYPMAEFTANFSSGDVDLTSSSILLESSKSGSKAIAHNVETLSVSGSFGLYVPTSNDEVFVGVCPSATTLSDVSSECPNLYYLSDGESKNSDDTSSIPEGATVSAEKVTIGGNSYWHVDGLTGTGAFGSVLGDSTSVPDTGFGLLRTPYAVVALSSIVLSGAITYLAIRSRKMRVDKVL